MTKTDAEPIVKRILFHNGLIILFMAVTVVLLATTVYFYRQYATLKVTSAQSPDEVKTYVEKIGRHILLPEGETPKVLTVTDKEKLSGQAFFANAKNGFKVLIYEKAKKAFLYDPQEDRVVEVGPVTFGEVGATVTPAATPSAATALPTPDVMPIRVYLYNGTPVNGLTREFDITIKSVFPNVVIVDRDNAVRRDYDESLVVDLTGTKAAQAAAIAKALDLAVSPLPAGETASGSADFLIILGNDKR